MPNMQIAKLDSSNDTVYYMKHKYYESVRTFFDDAI